MLGKMKSILLDDEFYKSIKDQTIYSEPDAWKHEEFDDAHYESVCFIIVITNHVLQLLQLAAGEFLMYNNAKVSMWLNSRKFMNIKPEILEKGDFIVLNDVLEKEFDAFKITLHGKCFLPENDLMHYWHQTVDLSPCKVINQYGTNFVELTYTQIDEFYCWFTEQKSKISNGMSVSVYA